MFENTTKILGDYLITDTTEYSRDMVKKALKELSDAESKILNPPVKYNIDWDRPMGGFHDD